MMYTSSRLACRRPRGDLATAVKTTEGSSVKLLSLLKVIIVSMSNQPGRGNEKLGMASLLIALPLKSSTLVYTYRHLAPLLYSASICLWESCSHRSSTPPS